MKSEELKCKICGGDLSKEREIYLVKGKPYCHCSYELEGYKIGKDEARHETLNEIKKFIIELNSEIKKPKLMCACSGWIYKKIEKLEKELNNG